MVAWNCFLLFQAEKSQSLNKKDDQAISWDWENIPCNGSASHGGRPRNTDRIFAVMRRLESKNVFWLARYSKCSRSIEQNTDSG